MDGTQKDTSTSRQEMALTKLKENLQQEGQAVSADQHFWNMTAESSINLTYFT